MKDIRKYETGIELTVSTLGMLGIIDESEEICSYCFYGYENGIGCTQVMCDYYNNFSPNDKFYEEIQSLIDIVTDKVREDD